jgi:hypothetical protein
LPKLLIIHDRQRNLFQIILATHAIGRLADFLDRGQEQADQDSNNGDDDEKFDQRKTVTSAGHGEGLLEKTGASKICLWYLPETGFNEILSARCPITPAKCQQK